VASSGAYETTEFPGNGTIVALPQRKTWDIGQKPSGRSAYVFVTEVLKRKVGTGIDVVIKAAGGYAELGFIQNRAHPADQSGNKMVGVSLGPSFSGVYNPNEGSPFVPISSRTTEDLRCQLRFQRKGTILRVNGANVYVGTDDEWPEYYGYIGSGDLSLIRFENLRVVRA